MSMILSAAGPPQKAFPYAYDQHDFPNGLRLITVPTEFPNVVALYIVVQTGSRNEVEAGKTGFAHFFEHMMFRGTKLYPPEKYEIVLKETGAANNAYTSDDRTVYHNTLSKEDLERMLMVEADRFQNLDFTPEGFRTEALAVLGEYNKNAASPWLRMEETLRETAFDKHTYKHTTLGFLKDIQNMPEELEYGKQFFARFYRPEYTTIIVVGDAKPERVRAAVEKYWGGWKRGSYESPVPEEPPQTGPRTAHIDWNGGPTLPYLTVAFKTPAYTDNAKDTAALDLIDFLGFSNASDLYQKLVIRDQTVEMLTTDNENHRDPYLFTLYARVKKEEDVAKVREQVLGTFRGFQENLVAAEKLDAVKRHLRYRFALSLDNSEAIASSLARFVSLRRTPDTINRLFDLYAAVTPEDLREVARKYFVEKNRTVVTLTGVKK